jgi:hypothetical protein
MITSSLNIEYRMNIPYLQFEQMIFKKAKSHKSMCYCDSLIIWTEIKENCIAITINKDNMGLNIS